MRDIIVIASKEKDRLILAQIFERIGANPFFAIDLNEAFKLLEKNIPRAIFIVEDNNPPTEIKIRELKRVAPLLPICILLRQRDASKAVEYMKIGAFDCAQSPWTEEEILPLFKKSLLLTGTEIKFEKPKKQIYILILLFLVFFSFLFYGIFYYGKKTEKTKYEKLLVKDSVVLPEKNISGMFFDEKNVYIVSWLTQNVYQYDKNELRLISVKRLSGKIPTLVSDIISGFIVLNDENELEKRMKDEKFTILGKIKLNQRITDICFDRMYLWTLNKEKIQKRVLNESLDILSEFNLNNKVENIACSNKNIYYYNFSQKLISKASIDDPQKIFSEFHISNGKLITMSWNENKLWYVVEENGNTILKYLKDEI